MSTLEAVQGALTERVQVVGSGDVELVTLPFAFSNGNLVRVQVTRVDTDRWLVSDRGLVAGELATAGVDLDSRQVAGDSWSALVAQMRIDYPLMLDVSRYELAGEASSGTLGRAIIEVAETAMRAEMLRVLAPNYRARSFREHVLATVGAHDLAITPRASMPTQHGGRRTVTVRVEAKTPVYVQAVSGKTTALDSFDKAQAMFSTANVPKAQLVAVLAKRVKLETWQWQTLEDRGTPIPEESFDRFLDALATA